MKGLGAATAGSVHDAVANGAGSRMRRGEVVAAVLLLLGVATRKRTVVRPWLDLARTTRRGAVLAVRLGGGRRGRESARRRGRGGRRGLVDMAKLRGEPRCSRTSQGVAAVARRAASG